MISLLCLLLLFPLAWSGVVLHPPDDAAPEQSFPTADYFQVKVPHTEIKNALLVMVRTGKDKGCSVGNITTDQQLVQSGDHKHDSMIFFIGLPSFITAGCVNVYEVVLTAQKYAQELQDEQNYPPLALVVMGMSRKLPKAVYGGPITEPYSSRRFGLPDGKPVVDTAFVQPEAAVAIMGAALKAQQDHALVTMDYSQEPGPWNAMFMGVPFLIYNWTLLTFNAAALLYGCYRMFLVVRDRELAFDSRTAAFFLAVVADVIFVVTLTMRHRAWWRILLELIFSSLLYVAFLLLLLLWIRLMETSGLNVRANSFRAFLALASVVVFASMGNTIYQMVHSPLPNDLLRTVVMDMALQCMQAIIATMFLYYALLFMMQRKEVRPGGETERTLYTLTYLALAGFLSFFLTFVSNKLMMSPVMYSTPSGYLSMWVLRTLAQTIRVAALLLVLNVRPPTVNRLTRSGSMMSAKSVSSMDSDAPTKVGSWLSKRSEQRSKTASEKG